MHTVLVVDDNDSIRQGLFVLLQDGGFEPHLAADGDAALDLAAAVRPDAVLLDVSMPGMDGLEVLGELRERYGPGLPVTVYSAVEDDYVRRRAERLGARFVPKGTADWGSLVRLIRGDLTPSAPQ